MSDPNEMSYIEHLKELRSRIIRMFFFAGFILICCLRFTYDIYTFISSPIIDLISYLIFIIFTYVISFFIT